MKNKMRMVLLTLMMPCLLSAFARQGDPVVIDAGVFWVNGNILYVQPTGELRRFDGKTSKTLRQGVRAIFYQKPDFYVVDRAGLHLGTQTLRMHPDAQIMFIERPGPFLVLYYSYGTCRKVMVVDAHNITQVKWAKDECQDYISIDGVAVGPRYVGLVDSGAITVRKDYDLRSGRLVCDTHDLRLPCTDSDDDGLYGPPTNCEDHSHDDDQPWVKALMKTIPPPEEFDGAYLCGPWQVVFHHLYLNEEGTIGKTTIHFHPGGKNIQK